MERHQQFLPEVTWDSCHRTASEPSSWALKKEHLFLTHYRKPVSTSVEVRKSQLLFISLVPQCASQICEIKKKKREVIFSLRTYVYISSSDAYSQRDEKSTSHKFTIQIVKKHWGKASLTVMAQYHRKRDPLLELIVNTKVQCLRPKKNVRFARFLFKVKFFFSIFGHCDSLFLIS